MYVQIEERSHDIWGGEEGLEAEHQSKLERREKKKEKKYAKEIKGAHLHMQPYYYVNRAMYPATYSYVLFTVN